jgi:Family of unknown function (DUF6282)
MNAAVSFALIKGWKGERGHRTDIPKYHLIMATGHNSPEDDLMLLRESRDQGVTHMIVTHAMMPPVHMTMAEMKQAAETGAYIEFVYNGLIGKSKTFDFSDYAAAIRAVGVQHCVLSSDLGQVGNPLPPDGLRRLTAEAIQICLEDSAENGWPVPEPERATPSLNQTNPHRIFILPLEIRCGRDNAAMLCKLVFPEVRSRHTFEPQIEKETIRQFESSADQAKIALTLLIHHRDWLHGPRSSVEGLLEIHVLKVGPNVESLR